MEQLDHLESRASGEEGCLGKNRKLQICEMFQQFVLEFPGEEEKAIQDTCQASRVGSSPVPLVIRDPVVWEPSVRDMWGSWRLMVGFTFLSFLC